MRRLPAGAVLDTARAGRAPSRSSASGLPWSASAPRGGTEETVDEGRCVDSPIRERVREIESAARGHGDSGVRGEPAHERQRPALRGGKREGRALRRADRRRRHLRHRRRLPPEAAMSGQKLRHPRNAGELRRHLADPKLHGHPLGYSISTSSAIASSPGPAHPSPPRPRKPEVHERGHRWRTTSTSASATTAGIARACWSSADKLWDHRRDAQRHRRGAQLYTAGLLLKCQGYYRHAEGYTPE